MELVDIQTSFNHSEQKIIIHLWDRSAPNPIFNDSTMAHVIDRMIGFNRQDAQNAPINRQNVVGIIVHIHSERDPCENCRQSLSLFSQNVQQALPAIFFPNAKFRCTVSSRMTYKGGTRYKLGHDAAIDQPIPMVLNNVPEGINNQPPVNGQDNWQQLLLAANPHDQPIAQLQNPANIHWFATTFHDVPRKPRCYNDLAIENINLNP